MKNIYGKKIELFQYQAEILKKIKNKNAIVAMPTGSGKTPVAYKWAFDDSKTERVIFTAPIKALSNERYRELVENFGKESVGINTGDIKKNIDAPIIACTQEIYTNTYASLPNQKVVIDEIHYIFDNTDRARAYVDGIRKSSSNSQILLLSATIGNPENLKQYIERVSNRKFVVAETDERPVPLEYVGYVDPVENTEYTPMIIFLFSYRGVEGTAMRLAMETPSLPNEQVEKIKEIAKELRINNANILSLAERGVVTYHGGLLFKEKVFSEELARKGLAKYIVGTDALSLGVNLPAKTVVFGQLAKYYDGPISKREFLQMAGRAGRYGLFDKGYVGFFYSGFESFDYDTESLYYDLLDAPVEAGHIKLTPDIGAILRKETTIDEEAKFISAVSVDLEENEMLFTEKEARNRITDIMEMVYEYADEYIGEKDSAEKFFELLGEVWFPEYDTLMNCRVARLLLTYGKIDISDIIDLNEIEPAMVDGRGLYKLLQIRKHLKFLKSCGYKVVGINKLNETIEKIDHLVLE